MCQELVRDFLSEYPSSWFSTREIADGTGLSLNSTFDNLKMMRKRSQVFYKTDSRIVGHARKEIIVYKFKRC